MRRASVLAAALVAIFAAATPSLADWCGASDEQNWSEFAALFTAGTKVTPGRPVIYIMGAPWCPVCRQTFKTLQSQRYNFDVRFIPVQAASEHHKDQIADIVAEGSIQSLARVYLQDGAKKDALTPEQRAFVNEVQEVADTALQERFNQPGKPWGTPMSFVYLDGIVLVRGFPDLAEIDRRTSAQRPPAIKPASTAGFVRAPVPPERPIAGVPFAKHDNVRLRILPDPTAFSAGCLKAGQGLRAAGVVQIGGETWIVFRPYQPGTHLRVYGRASEFDLVNQ